MCSVVSLCGRHVVSPGEEDGHVVTRLAGRIRRLPSAERDERVIAPQATLIAVGRHIEAVVLREV